MNKAVLIIDMPQTCYDCEFCESGRLLTYRCGRTEVDFEFINGERKVFCPLKPMPKKKEIEIRKRYRFEDAIKFSALKGYNRCIEDIEGEADNE